MPGLMSGDWKRGTALGQQRLQIDAWTAPDLSPPRQPSTLPSSSHTSLRRLSGDLKQNIVTHRRLTLSLGCNLELIPEETYR